MLFLTLAPISQFLVDLSTIIAYGLIGASLKYSDQAFDEGVFSKRIAWLLAIATGLLMGILITFDASSTILLTAIIIGVAVTGKLDTGPHRTSAVIAFLMPVVFSLFPGSNHLMAINWVPLVVMVTAGVADELLDGLGDRRRMWVFTLRPFMKVMAFLFVALAVIRYIYFFAFIAFDIAYLLVRWYSSFLKRTVKGSLNLKEQGLCMNGVFHNQPSF